MAINIQAKQDVSYLFSGLGGKQSNALSDFTTSGALSEYSNIKSGTYSKLMKAYYGEAAEDEVKSTASKEKTALMNYASEHAVNSGIRYSADGKYTNGIGSGSLFESWF